VPAPGKPPVLGRLTDGVDGRLTDRVDGRLTDGERLTDGLGRL